MTKRPTYNDVEKIPFDTESQWGRHRNPAWARRLLIIGHAISIVPGGRIIAKQSRKLIRRHLDRPMDMRIWGYYLRLMTRGNNTESKWLSTPYSYERKERRWIKQALSRGDVFVDIGANAGFYCIWADRCTDGQVNSLAIEPDPDMTDRLRYNIKINNIKSITIAEVAVGDTAGTATLNRSTRNRGANTLLKKPGMSTVGNDDIQVRACPLPDLCAEYGIDHIDILKIDVEGYEYYILSKLFEFPSRSLWPRYVLVEHVHSEAWQEDAIDMMAACGYDIVGSSRSNIFLKYSQP